MSSSSSTTSTRDLAHTVFIPAGIRRSLANGRHCACGDHPHRGPRLRDPVAARAPLRAARSHRPIGPREWVEGEEPDLLLLEPASRPGVRLARGVRRRFPQLPILCVSIDGPSGETLAARPVGPRDEAVPPEPARAGARARAHPLAERSRGSRMARGRAPPGGRARRRRARR